jgi:uncharacterized protein (TIGR00730 family)
VSEFRTKDTWTLFRIMAEFVEGFETLAPICPAVSVFGGARAPRDSRIYELGREIGRCLGREGFAVITGGGPGAMEAANRGAHEVKAPSVGLNIKLPFEQHDNGYADTVIHFDYFFARKVMFVKYACAFVFLPGGFGTLDEMFECLTLKQTGKSRDIPVILAGSEYWSGLLDWLQAEVMKEGLIGPKDLKLFSVVDTAEEACRLVREGWERLRPAGFVEREGRPERS